MPPVHSSRVFADSTLPLLLLPLHSRLERGVPALTLAAWYAREPMKCVVPLFGGLVLSSGLLVAEVQPPALRLDGSAVPTQYRLDLTVVPERETFAGTVEIDVNLNKPSSLIWLNGSALEVAEAVIRASGIDRPARSVGNGKGFVGLQTATPVPAGIATLRIRYSGKFKRNAVEGLFTREDSGDLYAYTDFEPLDARAAFPCFDEPSYKAPWQITLHVPERLQAFSNAPIASEAPAGDGLKTVRFKPTQPISTYLVAFAVGPFEIVDAGTAGQKRTKLRIIVPKGRASRSTFARDATPKIFEALERYFGIPYPFDKLDQIAFTHNAGAMENAGLITYGQQFLSAPPAGDSAQRQRIAAAYIAHEIAHQWFGNLTTMNWWDDIWLNEAFATWMETKVVHEVFPEWKALIQRLFAKSSAISQDSLASARRIRQPVSNAGEIGHAFDSITYLKGGSVISMFENHVGPEPFRKGVRAYLQKHAWKNTTASDFLAALSSAAGKDIARPFSTFLDRAGVPLLRVRLQCENGATPRVDLRQERLLPLGSSGERNQTWQVPVCLSYPAGSSTVTQCALLSDPKQTLHLQKTRSCPEWINADGGGTGYYGVIYEQGLGGKLATAGGVPLEGRISLLLNARILFEAGLIRPEEAIPLAINFATAPDRDIANAAFSILGSAQELVSETHHPAFARLVVRTLGPAARRLGWHPAAGENHETRLLRASVLRAVLNWGNDKELQAEARELTLKFFRDAESLDPGVASSVVSGAARRSDPELLTALLATAEKATDVTQRSIAVAALGSVANPEMAKQSLQWVLTTNRPPNERTTVLILMGRNPQTASVLWEFVRENYDRLTERVPARLSALDAGAIIIRTLGGLCTAEERQQVQTFFAGRAAALSGGPRALAQTLENIDLCVARRNAHQPAMTEYLTSSSAFSGSAGP